MTLLDVSLYVLVTVWSVVGLRLAQYLGWLIEERRQSEYERTVERLKR